MKIWIDAQLSPSIALWISQSVEGIEAQSLRAVGLRDATDKEIFEKAGRSGVVIMSKDDDFVKLLDQFGPPPQIIWISCGNTSNARMREVLARHLPSVAKLLKKGNNLVEISDK